MAPDRQMTESERENRQVLDYIYGRLGDDTSAGQCIMHIGPGGVIRKVEWRRVDRVEDIIAEGGSQT